MSGIPAPMNVYVSYEMKHLLLRRCFSPLQPNYDTRGLESTPPASVLSFSSGSGRFHKALASAGMERARKSASSNLGKKKIVEKLWREFFSDSSQWWDHRSEKEDPRYPDFRHKQTRECLWLNGNLNPPWVEAELSAIAPQNLQEHIFSWNKRLARFVEGGQYEMAFEHFDQMQGWGIRPDRFTFTAMIRACAQLRALKDGKLIHEQIVQCGYGSDLHLNTGLVGMYSRCGSIDDAQRVFEKMSIRDAVSWNAIILGHVKCGQGQKALDLSQEMQGEGVEPDAVTFVGMLNACTSIAALEKGRLVHVQIIQRGLGSGVFVGSSLINMYATCGSIDDAREVFNNMPVRDVACWNAMIQGYVKCAQGQKALDIAVQMQQEGLEPNAATIVGFLNACASVKALAEGRKFHKLAVEKGLGSEVFVGISLIHLYIECGSIKDAWRIFNRMPTRNTASWNAMIEGCVRCTQAQKALELYQVMYREGLEPDVNTFAGVLKACASIAALKEGKRIHKQTIQRGLESALVVGNSLIHMYATCGRIDDARTVFNEMPKRDVVSWNVMIQGYVSRGQGHKAIELYLKMQMERIEPNTATFVAVINACSMVGALDAGKRVEAQVHERGLGSDVLIINSLSKMYLKCQSINKVPIVM